MYTRIQLSLATTNLSYLLLRMVLFKVSLGLYIESTRPIEEDVDNDLIEKMRTGQPLKLTGTGVFKWTQTQNDAIPANPQWLKFDRQVL